MANFDSEFFGLVFSGFQASPKNSRPKFTPRIVGVPLQFHFREPKIYSRRFSAYGGRPTISFRLFPESSQQPLARLLPDFGAKRPDEPCKWSTIPSQQGKLPTELIPLENYLEIGNGLPNRKNCFGALFGPVMELNR